MSKGYKPHPCDVISHAHQKIDFIADAMACDDFDFSTSGQNGLYYLLRQISKELQESEIHLSEAGAKQVGKPCRTDT